MKLTQGVAAGVPKTAYLKLIDVWVFFCLLVPFIVFLIEFTWEAKKNKEEQKLRELATTTAQAWSSCPERKKIMKGHPKTIYRSQVQFLVVAFTITFVTGYFGLALFYSHNMI
jgi:hypothetical protein